MPAGNIPRKLVYIDIIASQGCYRFVGCNTLVVQSHPKGYWMVKTIRGIVMIKEPV